MKRKSKARPWHALTPEKVAAINSPGRYTDGGCLSLVVRRAKKRRSLMEVLGTSDLDTGTARRHEFRTTENSVFSQGPRAGL